MDTLLSVAKKAIPVTSNDKFKQFNNDLPMLGDMFMDTLLNMVNKATPKDKFKKFNNGLVTLGNNSRRVRRFLRWC